MLGCVWNKEWKKTFPIFIPKWWKYHFKFNKSLLSYTVKFIIIFKVFIFFSSHLSLYKKSEKRG